MTRKLFGLAIVSLLLGAALSLPAAAQPRAQTAPRPGVITGRVTDSTGGAIAGISVVLRRDDGLGPAVQIARTDAEGVFTFGRLRAGTYSLEVRAPGFSRFFRDGVAVEVEETRRIVIRLREATAPREPPRPAPAPPPPPPARGRGLPPVVDVSPIPASDDAGEAIIPVFYATDRNQEPVSIVDYGSGRSPGGRLALGRFDVSIPRDHQLGNVERPTIWTLFREDPALHFVITRRTVHSYQGFYDDIRSVVAKSTRKDAFVFIHGFNVAFVDAVMRTAQIAYDLGFDGAPILYSWPSNTGETPLGYTAAQNNNDWTVGHLESFLRDVAARTGARRIHLIAHSMGNRALVNALSRMPWPSPLFSQIVLTAPDMDADTFVDLAAAVARSAERTTLYASGSDLALSLSKRMNAYRRAGDTRPRVLVVPGIDTVDVTAVDSNLVGHFYYGDNRSVISDLFLLLTQGLGPSNRPSLRAVGSPPQFWRFVP